MGADESKPNRRPQARVAASDEIARVLLLQRLEYERKCQEYEQAQRMSTTQTAGAQLSGAHRAPSTAQTVQADPVRATPTPPRTSQPAPYNTNPFSHNLSTNRVVNNTATAPPTPKSSTSSTTACGTPRGPHPPVQANPAVTLAPTSRLKPVNQTSPALNTLPSSSLERERNPYSYTQNDLDKGTRSSNVYPRMDDFVSVNNGDAERPSPSAPARDRSASRSRPQRVGKNANNNHPCPTCKVTFGLTIFNCPNGHGSCGDCKARSAPCGVCGLQITDMRNRALEGFMAETKTSCPNADDGCCLLIKLADMGLHLKECPFNELRCPLSNIYKNCSWRGKMSHVSDHVCEVHPQNCHINVDTEAYLPNICFDDQTVHFVTVGPFKFLFTVKVSSADRMIYVLAQLLGTQKSASKWNYELHVYNKREPRRKYQYIDVCHSASVPVADIIRDSGCGAIPLQHALTYINEGVLTYKFFLNKIVERKDFANKNFRGRGAKRRN